MHNSKVNGGSATASSLQRQQYKQRQQKNRTMLHQSAAHLTFTSSIQPDDHMQPVSRKSLKKNLKALDVRLRFNMLTAGYSPLTTALTFPSSWSFTLTSRFLSFLFFPPPLPLYLSISLFPTSPPPHSVLPSPAPERNEPPLHSGTLFLWQWEPSRQVSRMLWCKCLGGTAFTHYSQTSSMPPPP